MMHGSFLLRVLGCVPPDTSKAVAAMLKVIYAQKSREAVLEKWGWLTNCF